MNKRKLSFFVISTTLLLVACGGGTSSTGASTSEITNVSTAVSSASEPSVSVESSVSTTSIATSTTSAPASSAPIEAPETLTFDKALTGYLDNAMYNERFASNEKKKTTDTSVYSSTLTTILDVSLDVYDDQSSFGMGTLTHTDSSDEETITDTYQQRSQVQTDKIEDPETKDVDDYKMFYHVENYVNDAYKSNDYKDVTSKLFILPEADSSLDESTYLVEEDVPLALTFQLGATLYNYVHTFITDPQISQTGIDSFTLEKQEGNEATYKTNIAYSYNGDMGDVVDITIDLSFTIDLEKDYLLAVDYENTNKSYFLGEEDDAAIVTSALEAELTYGEKTSSEAALIDANDFFLSNVEDVKILNEAREEVPATNVPKETSLIFALPSVYTPSQTVGLDEYSLAPVSSTDTAVVKLDAGYFEVVSSGTTTLTWSYFGLDNGVYREKRVSKTITINEFDPVESITIPTYDLSLNNYSLVVGDSVSLTLGVAPATAKLDFTVTSSDAEVASATINEKTLTITALKEGETTITVASKENPEIKDEVTIKVVAPSTEDVYLDLLLTHKFVYTNIYSGATYTLYFSEDGTGYQIEDSDAIYHFDFEWRLEDNIVYFENYQDDEASGLGPVYSFSEGKILDDLSAISFDDEENYTTRDFIAEPLEA